jgi:hypothetical protein
MRQRSLARVARRAQHRARGVNSIDSAWRRKHENNVGGNVGGVAWHRHLLKAWRQNVMAESENNRRLRRMAKIEEAAENNRNGENGGERRRNAANTVGYRQRNRRRNEMAVEAGKYLMAALA